MKPLLPTVTPQPSFSAAPFTLSVLTTTTTQLPRDEFHMQVHTILIVVIFCVVCLLLLLAFLYAFCLHCSISSSPKDSNGATGCSLEREDATYKCSSSDNQSVGNIVWLWHQARITDIFSVYQCHCGLRCSWFFVVCKEVCFSTEKKIVIATLVHLFISHWIWYLFVCLIQSFAVTRTLANHKYTFIIWSWNARTVFLPDFTLTSLEPQWDAGAHVVHVRPAHTDTQ